MEKLKKILSYIGYRGDEYDSLQQPLEIEKTIAKMKVVLDALHCCVNPKKRILVNNQKRFDFLGVGFK